MRNLLLAFLCWGIVLSVSPLSAEELWVRNRPFSGIVRGTGQDMMVELDTFLKTLELKVEDQGQVVLVGGFPIPVEQYGSVRLVPLRDMVDAAGLKISSNTALGTIDVRAADAGTGSSGDWSAVFEDKSRRRRKGPKTLLEGELFKVNIPSQLAVRTEAKYLKTPPTDKVEAATLNYPDAASTSYETAFLVSTNLGPKEGVLTFTLLTGLTGSITPEDEKEMFEFALGKMMNRGGKILQKARNVNQAGQKYRKAKFRDSNERGEQFDNEFYFRVSPKRGAAFLVLISAPKARFQSVAPQLRLVVRNLRYKD